MENEEQIKKLKITWIITLVGLISFLGVSYFISQKKDFSNIFTNDKLIMIKYICYSTSILLLPISHYIYNWFTRKNTNEIKVYVKAKKIQYFLIAGSGILSVIAFATDNKPDTLILLLIAIIILMISKPTEQFTMPK